MSGFGLAGFANGLNNGLQLGMRINELRDQDKIAKVREQGIAEAKALQAKAAPQVQDNGDMQNLTSNPQSSRDPNANPDIMGALGAVPSLAQQAQQQTTPQPTEFARSIPPEQVPLSSMPMSSPAPGAQPEAPGFASGMPELTRKRFSAGNQQFDTKEEADAYAKSQMPDIETFYAKTLVPRMKDQLISMGRTEEAAKWEKYAEETKTKGHMKTWARAFQFAQLGDYEKSAEQLMKLYPDYDDGFELVSAKKDKGPNNEDGFTMKVKDSEGNVREVFHNSKTIVEVGLPQLSPIEMFQQQLKRRNTVDAMEAKESIDNRKSARDAKEAEELEAKRQKGMKERNDADNKAAAERAEMRAKASAELAKTRATYAAELKSQAKKGDSPEKMRMRAYEVAARNPMWPTLDAEQREEEVGKILEFVRSEGNGTPQASTGSAPNPFAGAKPKGVPVFRNGKIEFINR